MQGIRLYDPIHSAFPFLSSHIPRSKNRPHHWLNIILPNYYFSCVYLVFMILITREPHLCCYCMPCTINADSREKKNRGPAHGIEEVVQEYEELEAVYWEGMRVV